LSAISTAAVVFPFERDRTYTFGELREFERALSATRQANQALSAEWRVPRDPQTKLWAKVREETYALMLLADAKQWRDEGTFRLTPYGAPAIDAEIGLGSEQFPVQITAAYPAWLDDAGTPCRGGYDERLVLEGLNKNGVVHGSADMRRVGSDVVAGKQVKSAHEERCACVRGIKTAVRKKVENRTSAARLLVECHRYSISGIDFPFEEIIREALAIIDTSFVRAAFGRYYFVDDNGVCFFEYPPH
jgi:hypothetical protein